jgi:hypothetical protein
MNFVDVSIQFPVEVSEEDPNPDSNIVPKERPNHPRLEQMWVIIWSRPSGIVLNKQAGMVWGELRKALESIERHVPKEWENGRKQLRRLAIPDIRSDDLEYMGIFVGKVYDDKIIQEGCSVRAPIIV